MDERSKILQRLASTAGCECSPEMQQLRAQLSAKDLEIERLRVALHGAYELLSVVCDDIRETMSH